MNEDNIIKMKERENLRLIIQQWNANRLDLFEITEPDEKLEFYGVMRYYFQDSGQKVSTKCIRVSSTATTRDVIETLIEKFRPDMRMLSIPEYTLYEIHEMEERRLRDEEKPLLVQLNWNKDDREGRFLLRRMDLNGIGKATIKTLPPVASTQHQQAGVPNFVRKLSRREKKELKKAEKKRMAGQNENSVREKLYSELPDTSFTRSISNPEAVMRRRRAQILEKKLQQFRSKDGGPDTGGTLKIYGESLCKDVPYKTLLLSVRDNASHVVREMLDKYGLREDSANFCLVQCLVRPEEIKEEYDGKIIPQKEYVLEDDECPLAILMNHPPSRGSIMFQVRRRPADHSQRKRKKKPVKGTGMIGPPPQHRHPHHNEMHPFLVELGPDGNELSSKGRNHELQPNVTEVGSDRIAHTGGAGSQSIHLIGPYIQPRHCFIMNNDGNVSVTPCSHDAETYVNFVRIYQTTVLHHGTIVRFGKNHTFRFIDPKDDRHRAQMPPQPMHSQPTYFERYGDGHPGSLAGSHFGSRASSVAGSQTSIARPPMRSGSEMQLRTHDAWNNYERFGPPRDPILPAVLEFREDVEDAFFNSIIPELDPTDIQFKLAPTYTLYMAARFRASTHYRPELVPTERAQKLTIMLTKVADYIYKVIEYKFKDPTALSFWMANASELLHFLKQDRHICAYSLDAQDVLAKAVQFAFRKLVDYMQSELSSAMPLFLENRDDSGEEEGCTAHVLSILTNTMALLRRCRVNAALTIQLFSQLFHYVNMHVFNKVVLDNYPNYCTREWGERIKERVSRIDAWAEKQGLELAADCHLAKLSQAALLLINPKSSPEDAGTVSSTCFKLNSLQLREILEKYECTPDEHPVSTELIDNVVATAETTADGLAREDGREITLRESADLQLPFLLPEDGYSCDILRGIPSGLAEFLEPMQRAGLCQMTPQPTSSGYWTIYLYGHQEATGQRMAPGPRSPSAMSNRSVSIPRGEPEVHVIELQKFNSGMGLSIVATKGDHEDQLGIYIRSVVPGGAADQDGRLQAGDQLLSVDGKSLVGISQEEAASHMVNTGPVVTLEVARQGALYHGLAPLLSQPSPQVSQGDSQRSTYPIEEQPQKRNSEGYDERLVDWNEQQRPTLPMSHPSPPSSPASRLSRDQRQPSYLHRPPQHMPSEQRQPNPPLGAAYPQPRIQPSKSVPSLNSDAGMKPLHPGMANNPTTSSNPQFPIRSRSTQNLNEGAPLSISSKHPSNPVLSAEDDRHYQNVSFHQGTQDPRMGSQRGSRPTLLSLSSTNSQDSQRPPSAFMTREEMRNEHHRPSSQQTIRQDGRFASNENLRKRIDPSYPMGPISPREERVNPMNLSRDERIPMSHINRDDRPGHIAPAPRDDRLGSGPLNTSLRDDRIPSVHPGMNVRDDRIGQVGPRDERVGPISPTYKDERFAPSTPTSGSFPAFQPSRGPYPGHSPGGYYSPSRSTQNLPTQSAPHQMSMPQQHRPNQIPMSSQNSKFPPPIAPKPNRNSGSHMEQQRNSGSHMDLRSPSHLELHRSIGSHLDVSRNIGPSIEHSRNFKPSMEPPEKPMRHAGFEASVKSLRTYPNDDEYRESPPPPPPPTSTHPLLQGGGSTQNVQVDKVLSVKTPWAKTEKERYESQKQEFLRRIRDDHISSLEQNSNRTHQEEEKLNAMKVEREFQRRAEEEDDDEEEERLDDAKPEDKKAWQEEMLNGTPTDRARKEDEIRRKQQELEAAREAEERILSEVKRRQEEDNRRRYSRHQHIASQRLDTLVGSNGLNGVTHNSESSPLPPERGSSYSVMHQSSSPLAKKNDTPTKKVQFSGMDPTYDSNANQEIPNVRHDPNEFLSQADVMLNSSPNKSTGNTPGVIGAQEVYRDPRQRRILEREQRAAATKTQNSENLTFIEKMNMFAKGQSKEAE